MFWKLDIGVGDQFDFIFRWWWCKRNEA